MLAAFRALSAPQRSARADRHLAYCLTFAAGAANAGGFMAVGQYTSHMSGIVSAMADHLTLGQAALVGAGLSAFLAFVAGAATSAILVNWARRRGLRSEYALPLMLEAVLLALFALIGPRLQSWAWALVPLTVMLLCFIMGLQNAIITKLSQARIRTTHITGLVTDMGIEIGKALYWNGSSSALPPVKSDRDKLGLLASLIGLFFAGGVLGAKAFMTTGFTAAYALAALVAALAIAPILEDLKAVFRPKDRQA
jgi:uncharacterized membrane protein YoaK (UPF0700 family)